MDKDIKEIKKRVIGCLKNAYRNGDITERYVIWECESVFDNFEPKRRGRRR